MTRTSRRRYSTYAAAAELAAAADARTLALFHHDPGRTDDQVAGIVQRTRQLFSSTVAAREGLSMSLETFDNSGKLRFPKSA